MANRIIADRGLPVLVQLWDVCEDQEAVDAITKAKLSDPQQASRVLLDLALSRFSSDNLSVMIVALKQG